jgi:hypothetical protein
MASERDDDRTTQAPSLDRRSAVKGALAAAGALGLVSLSPPGAHAQRGVAPASTAGGAALTLAGFLNATAYGDLPPGAHGARGSRSVAARGAEPLAVGRHGDHRDESGRASRERSTRRAAPRRAASNGKTSKRSTAS